VAQNAGTARLRLVAFVADEQGDHAGSRRVLARGAGPRAAAACPRAMRYVTIGPGHWGQAPPTVKFVTHPIREWNGHSRHFRMIYMIFAVPHGDGNGLQRVRAERCHARRARILAATARYRPV